MIASGLLDRRVLQSFGVSQSGIIINPVIPAPDLSIRGQAAAGIQVWWKLDPRLRGDALCAIGFPQE